jgi:hypothetical protein
MLLFYTINWRLNMLICFLLLAVAFGCSTPAVRGTIYYQGERIDRAVNGEPVFHFKDGQIAYRHGEFVIQELAPGSHAMEITVAADKHTTAIFAGDYYLWFEFGNIKDVTAALNVHMRRVIHLTAPVDNADRVQGTGAECMNLPSYPAPLNIAWDALEKEVYYDYEVVRVLCPFNQVQVMVHGTTRETMINLGLPRSKDKEFYLLRLSARKEGRVVGDLVLEGAKGTSAWDIRFRIAE